MGHLAEGALHEALDVCVKQSTQDTPFLPNTLCLRLPHPSSFPLPPPQGASKSGMKGFFRGFGKGIVGVVTQPVSGAIDMVSRTAEGALGTVKDIKETLGAVPAVPGRRRLPRVIKGDGVVGQYR